MTLSKPFNTFCVISQNVNTLSTQNNYVQWKAASHTFHSIKADAVSIQEPNVAWTKTHKQRIHQILQKPRGTALLSTTISSKPTTSTHQQGGMLQAILGDWVPHTVQIGQDTTGLGRWSYVELQGANNKRYIMLSGCRVCETQSPDLGSNSTYNQQYHLLHQQGNHYPDPQTQFLDNIIKQILTWQQQQKAFLICIDANKNPQQSSESGITCLFEEIDLINLHTHCHPIQC